ncbi:hypothetical protein CBR_g57086 [Chara braunii]|uniref:CUE domain-containing protein n=1 Tax=Chara braunii TaxID=69332 RepID=A0A388K839_CHABU|nr:hypothetical protein CBR_g57086 [Chara braunii]|eukprot:GBG66207.1 hypothetical protein CBR_g57086 [Chara braunii]
MEADLTASPAWEGPVGVSVLGEEYQRLARTPSLRGGNRSPIDHGALHQGPSHGQSNLKPDLSARSGGGVGLGGVEGGGGWRGEVAAGDAEEGNRSARVARPYRPNLDGHAVDEASARRPGKQQPLIGQESMADGPEGQSTREGSSSDRSQTPCPGSAGYRFRSPDQRDDWLGHKWQEGNEDGVDHATGGGKQIFPGESHGDGRSVSGRESADLLSMQQPRQGQREGALCSQKGSRRTDGVCGQAGEGESWRREKLNGGGARQEEAFVWREVGGGGEIGMTRVDRGEGPCSTGRGGGGSSSAVNDDGRRGGGARVAHVEVNRERQRQKQEEGGRISGNTGQRERWMRGNYVQSGLRQGGGPGRQLDQSSKTRAAATPVEMRDGGRNPGGKEWRGSGRGDASEHMVERRLPAGGSRMENAATMTSSREGREPKKLLTPADGGKGAAVATAYTDSTSVARSESQKMGGSQGRNGGPDLVDEVKSGLPCSGEGAGGMEEEDQQQEQEALLNRQGLKRDYRVEYVPGGGGGGGGRAARSKEAKKKEAMAVEPLAPFFPYLPQDDAMAVGIGIDDSSNAADTQEVVDSLNRQLGILLRMTPKQFWRQVVRDASLHAFLDSYLRFRRRWFDLLPDNDVKEGVGLGGGGNWRYNRRSRAGVVVGDAELARRVFMLLFRLSTSREPGVLPADCLAPKEHAAIIYEKGYLDLPKLMDVCAIYGRDNQELTRKLIGNVFSAQGKYRNDVTSCVPHVSSTVEAMSISTRRSVEAISDIGDGRRGMLQAEDAMRVRGELLDVADFLHDLVATFAAFVEVFPPAAEMFVSERDDSQSSRFLELLARIYDELLPLLKRGLAAIASLTTGDGRSPSGTNDPGANEVPEWRRSEAADGGRGQETAIAKLRAVEKRKMARLRGRTLRLAWNCLWLGCLRGDEEGGAEGKEGGGKDGGRNDAMGGGRGADAVAYEKAEATLSAVTGLASWIGEAESRAADGEVVIAREGAGSLLRALERKYDLASVIHQLRESGMICLDDPQMNYLVGVIAQPKLRGEMGAPASQVRQSHEARLAAGGGRGSSTLPLSSGFASRDVRAGGAGRVGGGGSVTTMVGTPQADIEQEAVAIQLSNISHIKECLPDYGEGFLAACLEAYDNSPEKVLQHILDNTLHPDLAKLDIHLKTKPVPQRSPVINHLDKGKGKVAAEVVEEEDDDEEDDSDGGGSNLQLSRTRRSGAAAAAANRSGKRSDEVAPSAAAISGILRASSSPVVIREGKVAGSTPSPSSLPCSSSASPFSATPPSSSFSSIVRASSSANLSTSSSIGVCSSSPSSSSSTLGAGRLVRRTRDMGDAVSLLNRIGDADKMTMKSSVKSSQVEYEDEYDDSFDDLVNYGADAGAEEPESLIEAQLKGVGGGLASSSVTLPSRSTPVSLRSESDGWKQVPSHREERGGKGGGGGGRGMSATPRGRVEGKGRSGDRAPPAKPQFFVKDGKNYSYKVAGSTAVSNADAAAAKISEQEALIMGLGPGGNVPIGQQSKGRRPSWKREEDNEDGEGEQEDGERDGGSAYHLTDGRGERDRPTVGGRGGHLPAGRGRGRGRGGGGAGRGNETTTSDAERRQHARKEQNKAFVANHRRKDQAMNKHFRSVGGN